MSKQTAPIMFGGKNTILSFIRLFDSDRGLLYINGVLRLAALGIVFYYFKVYRSTPLGQDLSLVRTLFSLFFVYSLAMMGLGLWHPEWFLRSRIKVIQSTFEVLIYSAFYYLSHDPQADLFFLYFIPLFFAVHFVEFGTALGVILFGISNLYGVLFLLSHSPAPEAVAFFDRHSLPITFGLRALMMVSICVAYAVRRRASLIQELRGRRSPLGDLLRSMDNGLFVVDAGHRLLFVNPILQERHGKFKSLQPFAAYFLAEGNLPSWNTQTGQLQGVAETGTIETHFMDKARNPYAAAVNLIPLQGDNGYFNTAIAIVKDVTQQRQLLMELDQKVQSYTRQVSFLASQRAHLLGTYYELGKRLTEFENLDTLMKFVVQETSRLLQAESSSLFLLGDGFLCRKAIAGADEDWLKDEKYMVGQGITGQVIVPQVGSKYGRPVRNNQVDRDPHVVHHYLKDYQAQLRTQGVYHLMAVPLNDQDHSFGVLRVVNKLDKQEQLDSRGFNESDQDFLTAIASMVAVALEKSRLLKDANERYQQANTLYAIGQHITQAANWDELKQVIVDETRAILAKASKATIYLIEKTTGNLISQASSEAYPSHSGLSPLHSSQGIAGKAIRERRVINVLDARSEPEFLDRGASELRSLLVAPLEVSNRPIGILSVDSDQVSAFNAGDQRLLGTLAAQASVAIEKTKLYQQERERRIFGETLLEVSRKINSNLNIKKMLPEILDELAKVIPYSSITLQVVESNHLRMIACRGFKNRKQVMELSFPLNNPKYPNYEVMTKKIPLLVNDVRESYPHFIDEAYKYHSGHIRSWMGIPLIHRDKVIGMVSLDHAVPNFYTEEMASLALTFANQVTIAIVNAKLFREKNEQLINLDRLFQAARTITSSIDIDEVLNQIVMLAKQVSEADHTGVLLLGERGERIDSIETLPVDIPLHLRARDEGVTTRVIKTRKPIIYNRVHSKDEHHNHAILEAGYQAYAGLPIVKGEKILGVLFVHSKHPGRFHRKREIALLQALCNHAAIAIENALLYKAAARQADMLGHLVESSNELIQHTDIKDLLEYCVQKGREIFQVEDCSLYLLNEERNSVDLVHSSTIPSEVFPRRDIYLDGPGLTAFVARTGETLNFSKDEYHHHPAWAGHHGRPFRDHLKYLPSQECHSLLMSPLKDHRGENIGVLKLENRLGAERDKKFSDFEVAMHQTFASHIGTAVERARLYQRLDKDARREARQALGYELHEIYNLIHGALVVRLEITREKLLRNKLQEVYQEIENMSKASRAANSLLRWIHYDLRGNDLIEEKGLILTLEHIGNLLQVPIKINISGRENLPNQIQYALYKIGLEALTNVAKHAGDQTQATITLRKQGGKFTFEISDNGFGFDEGEIFHSTVTFGFEGMKRWAESIGAKLDVKSQPSQGTTVCVEGYSSE